jgi:caa(3)-type oxidase subunit IV
VSVVAQAEHKHDLRRTYLTVWFWLFVLSFGLYFVDLMHLPTALATILYTAIALMKAGLIAAYFMHLRFERSTSFTPSFSLSSCSSPWWRRCCPMG